MKKIIPLLVFGILVFSGIQVVALDITQVYETFLEPLNSDMLIVPITKPYIYEYSNINKEEKHITAILRMVLTMNLDLII